MSSTRRRASATVAESTIEVDNVVSAGHNPTNEILPSTEMGYVLVSESTVFLKSAIDRNTPRKKWMEVGVVCAGNPPSKDDSSSQENQADDSRRNNKLPCHRCNLIFQEYNEAKEGSGESAKSTGKLCLWRKQVARYQGTIADLNHPKERQTGNSRAPCREKKRSDASLLLGAILDAQDHGYVSIQTFQILLQETNKDSQNDETFTKVKASLLVTLAFPFLAQTPGDNKDPPRKTIHKPGLRSIVPASRRTKNNSNIKPLPPSMQLLLTLIRSDWNSLDHKMRQLEKSVATVHLPTDSKAKESPDYFPSKLSLEELYIRIRGSASKDKKIQEEGAMQQEQSTFHFDKRPGLVSIPIDILKTQIAPFLRAKSLDALRCTCQGFHKSLGAVVPGLKLRLFQHQIKSLQWMRLREIRPVSEAMGQKLLENNTTTTIVSDNDDSDPIRAMTGGQSVWLCPRWTKEDNSTDRTESLGLRINQMTGCEMPAEGEEALARQGARGGLLCDDPGLGKTITILALILQTVGVSTESCAKKKRSSDSPKARSNEDDKRKQTPEEQVFQAHWKEDIPKEFRGRALCRVMAKLKRLDHSVGLFFRPIDPKLDGCEDYFEIVQHPICFNDIYKKISDAKYGADNSDFDAFVSDVELCFRNAMEYNPSSHDVHKAARNLLKRFQAEVLVQFKKEQLGSLRSSSSNAGLKPNSSVAALMQKKSEQEFQKSLLHSSSTLIVIPPVLMEHWEEQIKMHVDFRYTTNLIPLIYEYTPARKSALGLEEALRLCQVDKTHFPLIFVDKAGTHKLPSPDFLAMFLIVITTTRRFTNEWKNGSFQEELVRSRSKNEGPEGDGKYVNYRLMEYGSSDEEACPLLKVNWLRMLVDEGHAMGRGKGNSAIRFASWISAQRRWAMTGTPTQQTASQNGLNNMFGLMQFLQHDFFSRRRDGDKVWKRSIARNWKEGHLASFFRLKSLLSLLMIRHTKLDIEELPLPIYNTTVVKMSPLEITTYNTLVSAVQGNLKLTSMKGKTSGQQDSLLNRSQAKHAQLALTNIRRVCCGGTRVVPAVTHAHWIEFLELCMLDHKMTKDKGQEMEQYLQRATTEQLSRCDCCGMLLSMLLVLPCGCLLCTECTDNQTNVCVMCDKSFDVDDFQRLQPGLNYNWLETDDDYYVSKSDDGVKVEPNTATVAGTAQDVEPNQDAGEAAVPQAVAAQDQLLLRPPQERRRTRKPGDGHICEYSRSFEAGKCTLCFDMHSHCKLVNKGSCCQVCYVKAQDCPESESKAHYLVTKLLRLYEEQQKRERDFTPTVGFGHTSSSRKLKVIVFSQFRETLNLVGNRVLRRFGTACVAEYWGKYRTAELHKFIHDPDCFVMLLGKDGSEGLDLSFVTHLVFLEAIWDKSLEQQAVARAWRMGATGPVQVETLLAKNSVEEQMNKLEELMNAEAGNDRCGDGAQGVNAAEKENGASHQRGKVQFLLKSLNLMAEVEIVPLPLPELVQKRFGLEGMDLVSPDESDQQSQQEPQAKKRKTVQRRVRFKVD